MWSPAAGDPGIRSKLDDPSKSLGRAIATPLPVRGGNVGEFAICDLKSDVVYLLANEGDGFEDRFFGLNWFVISTASKADFGFTRPVRYLRPFSVVGAIFRCAWRQLSEQNL